LPGEDVIEQCASSQGACRLLGLPWETVWGVMSRAMVRELDLIPDRVIPV